MYQEVSCSMSTMLQRPKIMSWSHRPISQLRMLFPTDITVSSWILSSVSLLNYSLHVRYDKRPTGSAKIQSNSYDRHVKNLTISFCQKRTRTLMRTILRGCMDVGRSKLNYHAATIQPFDAALVDCLKWTGA